MLLLPSSVICKNREGEDYGKGVVCRRGVQLVKNDFGSVFGLVLY